MLTKYYTPAVEKALCEPIIPLVSKLPKYSLSWAATFFGLISAVCISCGVLFHALLFLGLTAFCGMLDHRLSQGKERALSLFCERLVEFALLVGLFALNPESRGLLTILMVGSLLLYSTVTLLMGIFEQGVSFRLGRGDRLLMVGIMSFFPALFILLAPLFVLYLLFGSISRVYRFIEEEAKSA